MSDAIDVFDISRLGDAGCDEIWVRIEDLKPLLSRAGLALVPAAEWERSRYKGCGSYPRAIGEIEGILGITGNVPLSETVDAVRKLAAKEAKG